MDKFQEICLIEDSHWDFVSCRSLHIYDIVLITQFYRLFCTNFPTIFTLEISFIPDNNQPTHILFLNIILPLIYRFLNLLNSIFIPDIEHNQPNFITQIFTFEYSLTHMPIRITATLNYQTYIYKIPNIVFYQMIKIALLILCRR